MTDRREYRQCVRVVICKGSEILLGKKFIDGKFVCYEFPGGGVEHGDSIEQTVIKECLEEVGILTTNVRSLGIDKKYEINYPNPERAKLYRGGIDSWYTCEYIKVDKSHFGADNDTLPFEWTTIDKALHLIRNGPGSKYNDARIEVLTKLKNDKATHGEKPHYAGWK